MKNGSKKLFWGCWERLAKIIACSYIVGPELEEALLVCRRMAPTQATTICYWDTEEESAQKVASAYVSAIDAIAKENLDSYVSIKAPALRFDRPLFMQVLERGRSKNVRLHFDSLGPEAADKTFAMIAEALPQYPELGCTLPGRWRRSLGDADWAVKRQLRVRVVKGQWPDLVTPDVDLRDGFLTVIDRLAGRARHVAVATHDPHLAEEALNRLVKAKTSCDLELLYGLPMKPASRVAQAAGVRIRVYLPYGHGYLPYALSQIRQNPGILWWVLRDVLKVWLIIGILVMPSWVHAEVPHPPPLMLTSQENGTEPQDTFSCSGTIYGYVTMTQAQIGKHTIEGIWIGPNGTVVQHSRNKVNYPSPGSRTAAVWLQFTKEGTVWNPLAVQNSTDQDRLLYDGPWKIEVRWDDRAFARSNFQIHCQ